MKNERHKKILQMIGESHIETQEELAGKLREAGYDVTQAWDRQRRDSTTANISGC